MTKDRVIHIIQRADAVSRGMKRFFTAEECIHGHLSESYVASMACVSCSRESTKAYRERHPQRAKESSRLSRVKHADARREDNKRWRDANKDQIAEAKRKYREENKEKVAAAKARYYMENKDAINKKTKQHRLENIEHYAANQKKWRENNRDLVRLLNRNRKIRKRNAEGSHDVSDIKRILLLQRKTCASCYKKLVGKEYHVDHIYPLALGGSNWPSNLQILCPPCNMSKGAKPPEEFYAERGFLI